MIDVGSNSVHVTVVDGTDVTEPVLDHNLGLRLAVHHLQDDHTISEDGITQLAHTVRHAAAMAREAGAETVVAYATSAVRDAPNSAVVRAAVERLAGVNVDVVPPDDEAGITYHAAGLWLAGQGLDAAQWLLLDIGGGSVEMAWGGGGEASLTTSLTLGSARLIRRLGLADPPDPNAVTDLRSFLAEELGREAADFRDVPHTMAVGTSRTLQVLGKLVEPTTRRRRDSSPANPVLDVDALARWTRGLTRTTAEERATLHDVSAARARQLITGALVAEEAMRALGIQQLQTCPWALREGMLLRGMHLPVEQQRLVLPARARTSFPARTRKAPAARNVL